MADAGLLQRDLGDVLGRQATVGASVGVVLRDGQPVVHVDVDVDLGGDVHLGGGDVVVLVEVVVGIGAAVGAGARSGAGLAAVAATTRAAPAAALGRAVRVEGAGLVVTRGFTWDRFGGRFGRFVARRAPIRRAIRWPGAPIRRAIRSEGVWDQVVGSERRWRRWSGPRVWSPPGSSRRTSVPSLMMRSPRGRARTRRRPAVPAARRRVRSIGMF